MKHHYLWSYAQIVSIIFQPREKKKRSSGKEKYSHKKNEKRKENLQVNQGMNEEEKKREITSCCVKN